MLARKTIIALIIGATNVTTACSDQTTAPRPTASRDEHGGQTGWELDVPPSSVEWQARARSLVAANNMSPLAAARVYAALSVAQYQAVIGIHSPDGGAEQWAPSGTDGGAAGGRSMMEGHRGAVAGASAQVLKFFFAAATASLEQEVQRQGEVLSPSGTVHPAFTRGLAVGRAAGNQLVDRAMNDRFTTPWTGTVPTGPGKWVANGTPAGATFGGVTPYFLTSGSQFRPAPPPAFGSPAFQIDLTEIRTLADNRTPAQSSSALAWDFPTGTFTPIGYWNQLATQYAIAHQLDEPAATRTFALTNAAMMDALIGCWEAKYYYWMLRPSQADPLITRTFGLPNHPSYPSGHSCASAAAAGVLASLFPDKKAELAGMVSDAGLSRMYAGIHYRFDITAGRDLGDAVARWVLARAGVPD